MRTGATSSIPTARPFNPRLVIGLRNDIVVPHLKVSGEQLQHMQAELEKVNGSLPAAECKVLEERLRMLETWRSERKFVLRVMEKFLAGPLG